MKHLTTGLFLRSAVTFLTLIFIQAIAIAQDASGGKNVTTHTTTTTTTWYAQPWVWIVGAAIFILLLVALTRGGGRSDKVTVTKTTSDV
jgi:hypothetical protein